MDNMFYEPKVTFFQKRGIQFTLKLLTALAFTLFVVYQIYLLFAIETSQIGRAMGIGCFLLITVASFLALAVSVRVQKAYSVVLIVGLLLLFSIKLMNIPDIFGALNVSKPYTVLTLAVYIFAQVCVAAFVVFFLTLRNKMESVGKRKAVIIWMSILILLFIACFVMECVLLIKYHQNVTSRLRYVLLSRIAYYGGFIGTAICFMLPVPEQNEKYKEKQGDFFFTEDDDNEVELIM